VAYSTAKLVFIKALVNRFINQRFISSGVKIFIARTHTHNTKQIYQFYYNIISLNQNKNNEYCVSSN